MEEIKGERKELQSDGAENHHQDGLDLHVFEVQIMRCLIRNALWLYAELCLLISEEHIFGKISKKVVEK